MLIPGFWHGTWCWNLVTEQLAARQIPSIAIDLTGQGLEGPSPSARWGRAFDASGFATEPSAVASVTATTAAKALIERLRLIGGGDPCVVVAHSMGGVVATLAAEMEPALVSHVVYVAALVPVAGLPAGAYVTSEENEGELGTALLRADPFAIGASRLDTGDASGHQAIRDALYGDVPLGTVNAVLGLLNPDAPVGIPAEVITVTPDRFGALAHTYITCSNDRMVRPALQHRFIREIDGISAVPTTVIPLDSSHSPLLSQPAARGGHRRIVVVIHPMGGPPDGRPIPPLRLRPTRWPSRRGDTSSGPGCSGGAPPAATTASRPADTPAPAVRSTLLPHPGRWLGLRPVRRLHPTTQARPTLLAPLLHSPPRSLRHSRPTTGHPPGQRPWTSQPTGSWPSP